MSACRLCRGVSPMPCILCNRDPRDAEIARMRDEREHYRQAALVDQPATIARLTAERDAACAILISASGQAHHEGTRATGLVELAREVADGVAVLDEEAARLDGWAVDAMRAARAWKWLARRLKAERDALRLGVATLAVQVDALALAAAAALEGAAAPVAHWEQIAVASAALAATFARLDPGQAAAREDDTSRCAVCQSPLAESVESGCVPGNCSMRPPPQNMYAPERAARERAHASERRGAEAYTGQRLVTTTITVGATDEKAGGG